MKSETKMDQVLERGNFLKGVAALGAAGLTGAASSPAEAQVPGAKASVAAAFHGSELAFVFDNGEICDHYSGGLPEALALSHRMGAAWVSFARTGNPNHKDLTHWPAYTSSDRATMIFDTPCAVRKDPEGKGLSLIRQAIANRS